MLESKMNWLIHNEQHVASIDIPVSDVIKRMLVKRGITTTEEANKFLYPSLNDLHDPFLFPDMKKAVDRIKKAIENNESILIFGDYDADGVTSTTVLMRTLINLGANVDYYIPNRFTEGYGPNEQAFVEAYESGYGLIITVDTGIAAIDEAALAKSLGIDLIITDHHEEQDELPDAYAIIHPRLAKSYPFDHLAGVGVALKLAQALLGEIPKELLGLAAIGTVADLVPLIDENRVIVKKGIECLEHSSLPGIKALKEIANVGEVTEESIGFAIGPRLNAVGRLQDASLAVDLLLEDDDLIALDMAKEVDDLNKERQKLVSTIAEEAFYEIEQNYSTDKVIVIAKENWNPGVLGIVASRVINKYYRPTILLSIDREKNEAKGSARSIPSFDIFDHGMALRDHFLQFGGHAQAAGMTVSIDNIDVIRRELNNRAEQYLTEEDFIPHIEVEDEIVWNEVDITFPEQLKLLAPYGMGNQKPIFKLNDILIKDIRKIGAKYNHIKMVGYNGDDSFDIIGFQLGDIADRLAINAKIDLIGEIDLNEWNGIKKLQIKLIDLRSDEPQIFDFRGMKQWNQLSEKIRNNDCTIITFQNKELSQLNLPTLSYNENIKNNLHSVNHIVFIDLPNDIKDLENVLSVKRFHSIFACFQNQDHQFFESIPTRDDFKVLYATLMKHEVINEKQKSQLADAKGWTLSQLDFMLQVFLDLKFVKIMNGVIVFQQNVQQQSLTNSSTYQKKLKAIEVEKTLYFSNYDQLKNWMLEKMASLVEEGEVIHGL